MCYRLLGSSLPLLSLAQLQMVLRGEVMLRYGIHVLSAQVGERHKVLVLVGETSPQFLQLNGYRAKLDKLLVYKAVLYAQFDGFHSLW